MDMTAEQFNERYPVGVKVKYWPVAGRPQHDVTRTRSRAWTLGCGEHVVCVERRTGGVSLRHIETVLREDMT